MSSPDFKLALKFVRRNEAEKLFDFFKEFDGSIECTRDEADELVHFLCRYAHANSADLGSSSLRRYFELFKERDSVFESVLDFFVKDYPVSDGCSRLLCEEFPEYAKKTLDFLIRLFLNAKYVRLITAEHHTQLSKLFVRLLYMGNECKSREENCGDRPGKMPNSDSLVLQFVTDHTELLNHTKRNNGLAMGRIFAKLSNYDLDFDVPLDLPLLSWLEKEGISDFYTIFERKKLKDKISEPSKYCGRPPRRPRFLLECLDYMESGCREKEQLAVEHMDSLVEGSNSLMLKENCGLILDKIACKEDAEGGVLKLLERQPEIASRHLSQMFYSRDYSAGQKEHILDHFAAFVRDGKGDSNLIEIFFNDLIKEKMLELNRFLLQKMLLIASLLVGSSLDGGRLLTKFNQLDAGRFRERLGELELDFSALVLDNGVPTADYSGLPVEDNGALEPGEIVFIAKRPSSLPQSLVIE